MARARVIEKEAWYKEADLERQWKRMLADLQSHYDQEGEVNQELLREIQRMASRLGKRVPVYFEAEDVLNDGAYDFYWEYGISTWGLGPIQVNWDEGQEINLIDWKTQYTDSFGDPLADSSGEAYITVEVQIQGTVPVEGIEDVGPDWTDLNREDYEDEYDYEDAVDQATDEARDEYLTQAEGQVRQTILSRINDFPQTVISADIERIRATYLGGNPLEPAFEFVASFKARYEDPMMFDMYRLGDMVIDESIEPNW